MSLGRCKELGGTPYVCKIWEISMVLDFGKILSANF